LKPENILYDSRANRLFVADFGIAHFEEDELLTAVETRDQERLANFIYAAPEQRARERQVDVRADIFALGLILNEMFTGTVPLAHGYPLIANVSPEHGYLDEIVARMIHHSPADRYQTIAKIKDDLLSRGNAFIEHQRLDQLRKQVVSAITPDDPLGGEDVRRVSVEYEPDRTDPKRGELIFLLDPAPPPVWQEGFKRPDEYRFIGGVAEPAYVRFYTNRAVLSITEIYADQVVRLMDGWISSANRRYRQHLAQLAQKQHQDRLAALQQEKVRAEAKVRVMGKITNL
jgi:hypothetical protein